MDSTEIRYGAWDAEFNDWDSGPFSTVEEANRATYLGLPKGADIAKYKQSSRLQVREWLKRGEAGQVVKTA